MWFYCLICPQILNLRVWKDPLLTIMTLSEVQILVHATHSWKTLLPDLFVSACILPVIYVHSVGTMASCSWMSFFFILIFISIML